MVDASTSQNIEFLIFNRNGLCLFHADLVASEILPTTSMKPDVV